MSQQDDIKTKLKELSNDFFEHPEKLSVEMLFVRQIYGVSFLIMACILAIGMVPQSVSGGGYFHSCIMFFGILGVGVLGVWFIQGRAITGAKKMLPILLMVGPFGAFFIYLIYNTFRIMK